MLQKVASRVRRFIGPSKLDQACTFVGTDEVSGQVQFDLLRQEGLAPDSRLLEIGCGCLNVGMYLIEYLNAGNYCGIDPNEWLRNTAASKRGLRPLIARKNARFSNNDAFNGSEFKERFDFIFSHSILSHAAHAQLQQYFTNAAKVLKPSGKIIASIRLAEGNAYGSAGSPTGDDSRDQEWVYPGVSWFKLATVQEMARSAGLSVAVKPEHTAFYTKRRPAEVHDWVVLSPAS